MSAFVSQSELRPIHPGEVLVEEFLTPMKLSQNRLALAIGVSPRRVNEIALRKRAITADTALRLSSYFGNSPQFWLGLQMDYDLDTAAAGFKARPVRPPGMKRQGILKVRGQGRKHRIVSAG